MISDLKKVDPRAYSIIRAAMEVHRVLGCGFLEPVYQRALAVEFSKRQILYQRETTFPVFYKEVELNVPYRPDFICFENVVVELKVLPKISEVEESQIINYLKVTRHETGLLLNFGSRSLEYRRFVLTDT